MLHKVKKRNLYEEIASQIMQSISEGYYKPGQQLPGEREMAAQLGVNRGSLREALRVLEFMRVVEKRIGEGVFIRDPARESSLEAVVFRFLAEDGLDQESLQGACEAIVTVESSMARLAARRAGEKDLDRLKILVAKMKPDAEDIDVFTDLDQEFHLLVGQLSKSPVLFSVASTMWIIMKRYAHALHLYPERRRKCAEGHRLILKSICAGNEEQAYKEMEKHLKGAFNVLLPRP
ncbi:GntR family transcriptional regulator, transcriptional repressor for pyruvate dehydrogenase complex [Desulfotomaculum arcticum]|uniref:GntR family transcriptional regulator, transcriptional repressor for pyruvate dehydrogenase complex n=1 Tax=Desulfotruncus arcticus DSM 17038 TaxID=1121424 RepID=A0A1I2ZM46_9FIRM|nr:FadR/GntR family transcriptional regulator [Desulfotruncus arcticus]SFH38903.1 GntR family transcriptional regulator, transcriptional repressor for pyruvate dehydrogenase complex [Desulfotomaculum arcticum] [Desulfotruncus arcticus DSM 17038]